MQDIGLQPGKTMLIVGATGSLGKAAATAMLQHGWRVRALTRRVGGDPTLSGMSASIEWVQGDAMQTDDVVCAAQGVDCVLHAANPPKYNNWRQLALPMLANSIEAAKASGARLILPGNIYNFGVNAGAILSETSPQNPATRKGRVRVEMEAMMQAAAAQGGRMMIVRAGDFFGGFAPSTWFAGLMVKPGQRLRRIIFPGRKNAGHAWAYLPDLAEAIAQLAEREREMPSFEVFHFAGHWTPKGIEMAESIRRASGDDQIPIYPLPWSLLYLASPFDRLVRELLEMRYLWQRSICLDNRKLVSLLGAEPHTALDIAVERSLRELACI